MVCAPSARVAWLAVLALCGCEAEPKHDARPAARVRNEPAAERPEAEVALDDPTTAATVATPPRALDSLRPDERRRYLAALDEGRRLHHERDFAGAVETFGRALDLLPGDPRALSEQGWAALHAGELDRAEAMLGQAAAAAGDDEELQASILYNQGRLAEAQHDIAAAIDAYQRSLRLRPHPATYRHLIALEGGTRYVFGPAVRPLQGPYKRLSQLCAEERTLSVRDDESDEDEEAFVCLPNAADGSFAGALDVQRRKLPAPWKALRFVEVRPNAYAISVHAALKVDSGWYVLPEVATLGRGVADTRERATSLVARVEELPGHAQPRVVLEVETRWEQLEGGVQTASERHRVEFLCGAGPSGVPSCTGALPRSTEATRRDASGGAPSRWEVSRSVSASGALVLRGDAEALDEPAAALLGEHPLVFP